MAHALETYARLLRKHGVLYSGAKLWYNGGHDSPKSSRPAGPGIPKKED